MCCRCPRSFLFLLLGALAWAGLSAAAPARAAARPAPERPLIFLPGVLGSKLCAEEGKGETVWGGLKSYSNFGRLALAADPAATSIDACGVIDSIKIFGPLEIHRYDSLLDHFRSLGYRDGKALFVFDYDWRQSNFESARRLAAFLARPELRDRKVDIVAHSMGGVVARIYVQELGGDRRVKRLVTLGTPHRGSLEIFRLMQEGFASWGKYLAGGREAVREVAFTFPSAYELLPFYDRCCALGAPDWPRAAKKAFSLHDLEPWFEAWLPPTFRKAPWRARVEAMLGEGERLARILERKVPRRVELFPVAGDHLKTLSTVYVDPETWKILHWAKLSEGDGTVLAVSASAGKPARVSFHQHSVIFRDGHLQTALARILGLRPGGPIQFTRASGELLARLDDGSFLEVGGVEVEAVPRWVASGGEVELLLRLDVGGDAEGEMGKLAVSGLLEYEGTAERSPLEIARDTRKAGARELLYRAKVRPERPGTHRAIFRVPGFPRELECYFAVGEK